MCKLPLICSSSTDGRTDSFSPSIPFRNLFNLGDFNCHHAFLGLKRYFRPPVGRKYLTGLFLLTSPSMTLTHPPFYIAPLVVAPLLTYPLLPLFLPLLASGRCFRTWVLTTYQLFSQSLSHRSFARTSVPLFPIFRKLAGMALPPTLSFTVLLQRNTHLFFFPLLLLLSLLFWH